MQVTVYDYDLTGKNELMGCSLIKLKPITAVEPQQLIQWYHLGMGHWSDPAGCGKGHGRIKVWRVERTQAGGAREVTDGHGALAEFGRLRQGAQAHQGVALVATAFNHVCARTLLCPAHSSR